MARTPDSHQYPPPDQPDSPIDSSSEDLNLEELDPVGNDVHGRGSRRWNFRAQGATDNVSQDVHLSSLNANSKGTRWMRRKRKAKHGGDESDLEGLLSDENATERPLNRSPPGPSSASPQQGALPHKVSKHSPSLSLAGFRRSLQLPEVLQSESAEPEQEVQASNAESRQIFVGQANRQKYPANLVSNAKYTAWSFLPRTLYNEFSFFLNIYFLLVALSQIIEYLRIGYMSTYIAPLAMVLTLTIGKEAVDDVARRRRDAEANAEPYDVVALHSGVFSGGLLQKRPSQEALQTVQKRAKDLKVGDVLRLQRNQRLPADVVILKNIASDATDLERTENATQTPGVLPDDPVDEEQPKEVDVDQSNSDDGAGNTSVETFIRTDQLDGETDWKLRLPSPLTQSLEVTNFQRVVIEAGAPSKNVNEFTGMIVLHPSSETRYDPHLQHMTGSMEENIAPPQEDQAQSLPLTIDNTAWANTIVASNTTTLAVIIYTGRQTRSAMSTSPSRSKTGLLDLEINNLTKILCALTLTLSLVLVIFEGFEPSNKKPWWVAIMIYLILFSTIIPISLRVNLDMAKSVYARYIERDTGIPNTLVRTSTIPEDLGRIEFLLSDKTGTLTRNEMELKKIHIGTVSYANEAMDEVATYVRQNLATSDEMKNAALPGQPHSPSGSSFAQSYTSGASRSRREVGNRVRDLILALALCHNVTPTVEEVEGKQVTAYQASSPDEIAIVQYTERVGLRLAYRDRKSIILHGTESGKCAVRAKILEIFPFTSENKRMGIIVQFSTHQGGSSSPEYEDDVWFYQKGADTVMSIIVAANDWLDEETANMAREGLRTLVIGRRRLSARQYKDFAAAYKEASLSLQGRNMKMSTVVRSHLEHDLELLGVTGVEDMLQQDVKPSLELLRNAGIKIWMLTGDKVETARCVGVSSKLVSRGQQIQTVAKLGQTSEAREALDVIQSQTDSCLLIDGDSLSLMLAHYRDEFIALAVLLPSVIACRCSPTQKAEIADLIRQRTRKRICCIGDGGNDVSMIQAADVGIGIVGKEGRQASLAADFSITQFCHLTKLLVWHGRNSYKRSAKLGQFIIHRGLIISVCQTVYSIASHFDPKGLFKDWLLVGYATVYTSAPIFSLVTDRDVDEHLANLYPELYRELKRGEPLSYSTFFAWVFVSMYQGIAIQFLSQFLVGAVEGARMLSVSFTVLVINELVMVAVAITTWHPVMIGCIVATAAVYGFSVPLLDGYFDLGYVASWAWAWRVLVVAAVSLVPVWTGKIVQRTWKPPSYRKVRV